MLILEALLLIGLIGITAGIIWGKDLMSLVIVYCMFSFATMLLYILMGAPDVAFTEAVIGVISTVYFIIILRTISRKTKSEAEKGEASETRELDKYDRNKIIILIAIMAMLVLPVCLSGKILPNIGDPHSAANTHVSNYYIEHTDDISNSPNMVTSVIVDFRAFDTMFETTVMFLAGLCVILILDDGRKKKGKLKIPEQPKRKSGKAVYETINKEVMISIIEPIILIYAIYVLFHGEVSLGGGFQAGALIAMVYLLDVLVTKRTRNIFTITKVDAATYAGLGPFIYAFCGVLTLIGGGTFLQYKNFPLPIEETELHSIGILMVEIGVTIGVMFTIIAILNAILERVAFDDDN